MSSSNNNAYVYVYRTYSFTNFKVCYLIYIINNPYVYVYSFANFKECYLISINVHFDNCLHFSEC